MSDESADAMPRVPIPDIMADAITRGFIEGVLPTLSRVSHVNRPFDGRFIAEPAPKRAVDE